MELRDDLKQATAPEPSWTRPSPSLHEITSIREMIEARIRRRRRIALMVTAALVACLLGFVIGVRATHPRDDADFLLAVRQGGVAPTLALDEEDILREGDFACRWLDQQDRAFWNHGPWYDREPLLMRYLQQTRPVLPVSPQSRGVVADAAWSQLCGATWYWHRPHGPRGPSGGSGGD